MASPPTVASETETTVPESAGDILLAAKQMVSQHGGAAALAYAVALLHEIAVSELQEGDEEEKERYSAEALHADLGRIGKELLRIALPPKDIEVWTDIVLIQQVKLSLSEIPEAIRDRYVMAFIAEGLGLSVGKELPDPVNLEMLFDDKQQGLLETIEDELVDVTGEEADSTDGNCNDVDMADV